MAKSLISAKEIVEHLRKRHPQPEWSFFHELRLGSGFSKKAQKRVDAWALNCYPSSKHLKIAYEIKVYRQDFLKEIKDPKKRQEALNLSNQFYFVAPKGVIRIDEVPLECGYIEIDENQRLKVVKEALWRFCKDPTWLFSSSLARRTAKNEGIDFANLSDEVINGLMATLYTIKNLNGTDQLLFGYLEAEKQKRTTAAYNQRTREQKARIRFYTKYRRQNPDISLTELKRLWEEKRLKSVNRTVNNVILNNVSNSTFLS